MHILYISNPLPRPDEPGAARPWVEATYLARQGHRITVITNQRHYLTDQIPEEMQGKLINVSHEAGLDILSVATPAGRRTSVVPTRVGVNRIFKKNFRMSISCPHAGGGEPCLQWTYWQPLGLSPRGWG